MIPQWTADFGRGIVSITVKQLYVYKPLHNLIFTLNRIEWSNALSINILGPQISCDSL